MSRRLPLAVLLSLFVSAPTLTSAQHVLTAGAPYQTSFEGFTAAGFAPEPTAGQLDSDLWIASPVNTNTLDFGGTSIDEDFANGPSMGGETAGGIWAFGPLSLACEGGSGTYLGVQPSVRTFTPGAFQVRLQNGTGAPLERFDVRYAFAVRNDEGRSLRHEVSFRRLDGAGEETERVAVSGSELITPEGSSGGDWRVQCRRLTVELGAAGAVPVDGQFAVAFEVDDEGGSGSRDELGVSDVWISADTIPDPPDAGVMPDGGTGDAGMGDAGIGDAGLLDAGQLDAGGSDAGASDAGPMGPDAATPMDAGTMADARIPGIDAGDGGSADGGCGCSVPVRREAPWPGVFAAGLIVLTVRRRRR